MDIGPTELLAVLAIVLLLFGSSKLPQLARSIGEAQREFRRTTSGADDDRPAASAPQLPDAASGGEIRSDADG